MRAPWQKNRTKKLGKNRRKSKFEGK
ncbi:unnamed protein product [Spirodela intermedia]|uniref:Uncharacterized protein n=1 Tax=Spirodela intermedia TaxID=51605 RepID=A0A7I8JQA5_SPIIN|nr:unnamed protein product [Spirodela intermedia]CAA6672359.1 unnamed protein product [Spirodela intermedia]